MELPSPRCVFNDISIVANVHRFTSALTYCHMMSEAHVILRVALILKQWRVTNDENNVNLIESARNSKDDLIETYRTSCALLADHFVMCVNEEDYALAVPYYKMAGVQPFDVLRRVKKIQEQSNNNVYIYVLKTCLIRFFFQSINGLMYYLKTVLLNMKHSWEIDRFLCGNSKQNFAETILDFLEKHNYADLPNLIIKSTLLREFSTDKLINILTNQIRDQDDVRLLALSIVYIHKCNTQKAQENLDLIPNDVLRDLLQQNGELLFDYCYQRDKLKSITFSELATILIATKPEILSNILVTLMTDKKTLTLHKLIRVFLEYLPASIGNEGPNPSLVLQNTLELYFTQYLNRNPTDISKTVLEKGANEALKLLVRSYLSQLQMLQLKEEIVKDVMTSSLGKLEREVLGEDDDSLKPYFDDIKRNDGYLFSEYRYRYLDKMAPFQIEITGKLYEACLDSYKAVECRVNQDADVVLKKLQAILCSQTVSKQIVGEVEAFLSLNENLRGGPSLRSIVLGINDAILLLIDVCPQCLLQFGKVSVFFSFVQLVTLFVSRIVSARLTNGNF